MATDELAQKLQRRLLLEESGPEPAPGGEEAAAGWASGPAGQEEEEGEGGRSSMLASADSELGAKLSRRQDINEGMAQPRQAKVFNPYTEFKEFSRRQIKDMEQMFRLFLKKYSMAFLQNLAL